MAKETTKKAVKTAAVKKVEPVAAPAVKAVKKAVPAKKAVARKVAPVVEKAAPAVVAKPAAVVPAKKAAVKKVAVKKAAAPKAAAPKAKKVTTVIAKIDAGFGNELFLRGSAAGLAWDKGVLMKNVSPDEWVWQSDAVTAEVEVKILLNDIDWAVGPNSTVLPGATLLIEPAF